MSWHRIKPPVKCVCGRSDWCLVSQDGSSFLCMRTESPKKFVMTNGDIGYIHKVGTPQFTKFVRADNRHQRPTPPFESMLQRAYKETTSEQIVALSEQLGVRVSALQEMRVAFGKWYEPKDGGYKTYQAWWFPMRNGYGHLVGLRARDWHGNKWAVTGSKGGIFYPYKHSEKELYVVEGASDVAAMLSMNLWAVGRPSCNSGAMEIKTLVEKLNVQRVIILSDNDTPGLNGARSLADVLPVPCAVMTLPVKDVREFVNAGGTAQTLESMANNVVWINV